MTRPLIETERTSPGYRRERCGRHVAWSERWRRHGALCALGLLLAWSAAPTAAQEGGRPVYDPTRSIARNWNEVLLYAVRRDFARPTVHARNLFHLSAAMYDVWAVHDDVASPYFLGRTQRNGERCELGESARSVFRDETDETARRASLERAISFAAYRLLRRRFESSPGERAVRRRTDELLRALGLAARTTSVDLDAEPTPEVLGNLVADCIARQGARDGSNEIGGFVNRRYEPRNAPLDPSGRGNPTLSNPNRWQPLRLDIFVDQSGNTTATPFFLGAEWGRVVPFALTVADRNEVRREGEIYSVYLDPGPPVRLGDDAARNLDYQRGHALVALWSAHLDPTDGVLWDISPGSLGNTGPLPENPAAIDAFYDHLEGGVSDGVARGHAFNPATGEPYAAQIVPRGDYTRVLAEFWADGPDSETPPGHWFRLYNEAVGDHPDFERRFAGEGPVLDGLEFDIKAYFLLGGTMHDSAIAAWSVKGAYDYVRPISAIRYMAAQGQSSDPNGPRYSVRGVPLVPGRIELVEQEDPLAGDGGVNVGKIKVRAWRGPAFMDDPAADTAGVGWILMENWWPYQRPTFVTPPFAGYVSGHSTFSRAAAEVLTRLTGDPFFPGGMAEFRAKRNEFLLFEDGPTVDVVLQWATYRDASDQTSLSRIWGGIHPPIDDVPGRLMGIRVGERAWDRARTFFDGTVEPSETTAPPSPSGRGVIGGCSASGADDTFDPALALLALFSLGTLRRTRLPPRQGAGGSIGRHSTGDIR